MFCQDYGNPRKHLSYLITDLLEKIIFYKSTLRLGSLHYSLTGIHYLGNISNHEKFHKAVNLYNAATKNSLPESTLGEELEERLRDRDKAPHRENRLQLRYPVKHYEIDKFPSLSPMAEVYQYVPDILTKRVQEISGRFLQPSGLNAWTQLRVPYIPWMHRDAGANCLTHRVFVLVHDTHEQHGPTLVWNKVQSYIISFFRSQWHLDLVNASSSSTLNFKPKRLIGKAGDAFMVRLSHCYHTESLLHEGYKRTMLQYNFNLPSIINSSKYCS